jgi:hypothetical protein
MLVIQHEIVVREGETARIPCDLSYSIKNRVCTVPLTSKLKKNFRISRLSSLQCSGFWPQKDKTHRRQCKMSSSKKTTCKGTLQQVFICLSPRTPYLSPLEHCIRVYSILIHTGRGGGGSGTRETVREATVHKAGSKIPTCLNVSPVYKSLYRLLF